MARRLPFQSGVGVVLRKEVRDGELDLSPGGDSFILCIWRATNNDGEKEIRK
jgi:hypothetical protein